MDLLRLLKVESLETLGLDYTASRKAVKTSRPVFRPGQLHGLN